MPRSRRKAAASRMQSKGIVKDFVKKKERLGRKSRPANATDVSVRARQIYIPDAPPTADQSPDASSKRGLTLAQLVARATHYSAATRQSALNGLARALAVEDATASWTARNDIARVLRIALAALQDESASVRTAANAVLAAALAESCKVHVPDFGMQSWYSGKTQEYSPVVAPFAPMLAARIIACLSHIRAEVQLSGAQAVSAVFDCADVRPDAVFGGRLPVLVAALSDLLAAVKSVKSRTIVLDALFAVLRPRDGRKHERLSTSLMPFYYHRPHSEPLAEGGVWDRDSAAEGPVLPADTEAGRDELGKRVVHVISESLPVHETKKDKAATTMLLAAVRTLYFLASAHRLGEKTIRLVGRVLETWSKERNRHQDRGDAHSIHNFLAGCALCVQDWKLAGAYIGPSLSPEMTALLRTDNTAKKGLLLSVEALTLNVLRNCNDSQTRTKILEAWMSRWTSAIDSGKISYATSFPEILSCIVEDFLKGLKEGEWTMPELEEGGWKILISLPNLIFQISGVCRKLMSPGVGLPLGGVVDQMYFLRNFLLSALRLLARASRICSRVRSQQCAEFERIVSGKLLQPTILRGLHIDVLEELVSVLYYTKAFASRQAMRALVQSLHIGSQVSLDFSLRLMVVIEANFVQFEEYGHDSILLDLYAAVSYVMRAKKPAEQHKQQWDEFISIAQRLSQRVDFVEE